MAVLALRRAGRSRHVGERPTRSEHRQPNDRTTGEGGKGTGKGKGKGTGQERLAHRACNTGKGAVDPVVPWPDDLFIADAAVIIATVDRLSRKGGREAVGRCTDRADADRAAAWIVDRISRLEPDLDVTASIEPGGGQYLLVLQAR